MKYETMNCRIFEIPTDPRAASVNIFDVIVAKDNWDEIEDADDERIFHYMDGFDLQVGDIISDGYVVVEIN